MAELNNELTISEARVRELIAESAVPQATAIDGVLRIGAPTPYDINAIHAQREAWRAEINRLERYGISD